jgi:hypothetical protein
MLTTAPPNTPENTPAAVWCMACELRENPWQLGCTLGHGQKPRERTSAARAPKRVREEGRHAQGRLRLPATALVVSWYDAGRASYAWPCGASSRAGYDRRGRNSKRRQWSCGAASPLDLSTGGGGSLTFRACEARRRLDGGASHRPSRYRQKTQGASSDRRQRRHGEKVVGDARVQRHRKPPDRSGLWDTALKACGEKRTRRGWTTAAT